MKICIILQILSSGYTFPKREIFYNQIYKLVFKGDNPMKKISSEAEKIMNGAFYIITYALSNKMKHIENNSAVAIAGDWFTAHGTKYEF